MSRQAAIEAAFRSACDDELQALKPGNVHVYAAGHGMTAADFVRSAEVAAPPLCQAGASLGERVFSAVESTRAEVGQNTNLGIILLCAPLAMAAEHEGDLRAALGEVLAESTLADADAVFRAIALAAPGGLGDAARHDVRAPATVRLVAAMTEAAGRDRIAAQYATGFADIFGPLAQAYVAARQRYTDSLAVTATYLRCVATWPDSHVTRKHGPLVAARVREDAVMWQKKFWEVPDPQALMNELRQWDAALKQGGINPGTSADLTVGTLFAYRLRNSLP